MWMSPYDHTINNRSKEWCAFESIIRHGIIDCPLTHMHWWFIKNFFLFVELCQKDLKNVNVNMIFVFIIKFGFSVMATIIGYKS
jgi:hypothetical protein